MSIIKAIDIAKAHQRAMLEMAEKIRTEGSCIGKLMVGRMVKRKGEIGEFKITETRLGLGSRVHFYGKRLKGSRKGLISLGTVENIEVVEVDNGPAR